MGKKDEVCLIPIRCFPFTDEEIKRANQVYKKYGLSPRDYAKMLDEQNDVCAICGNNNNGKYLVIDHCHNTGKVRGLLCGHCNSGLGMFRDNLYSLRRAIRYLEKVQDDKTYDRPYMK